jgi:hypothetical protein
MREYLGEPSRSARQVEIMNLSFEDIEGELVASGWVVRLGDDDPISEELLADIEERAWAMDAYLEKRVERLGITTSLAT